MAGAEAGIDVSVTPDGGVTKVVLVEGSGEVVPQHARCLVHYVGRLADSGEVFMDTRQESSSQEPLKLVAGRDSVRTEAGLHLALPGMRRGERARVRVAPQYGYGEAGNFSFPTVPSNAALEYDVDLVDWEEVDEERDPRGLTFEDRLEAAERRRADGNAAFRAGRHEEALSKYRLALSYLDEDLLIQLEGFHLDKAQAVRLPALLNTAACHLASAPPDYSEAAAAASEALALDPGNAKALYRRGRARRLLGQTSAALVDLEAARAAAPGDAAVLRELHAVRADLRGEREAESRLFKGYFDRAKASLYEDGGSGDALAAAGGAAAGGWLARVWTAVVAPLRALLGWVLRGKPHLA